MIVGDIELQPITTVSSTIDGSRFSSFNLSVYKYLIGRWGFLELISTTNLQIKISSRLNEFSTTYPSVCPLVENFFKLGFVWKLLFQLNEFRTVYPSTFTLQLRSLEHAFILYCFICVYYKDRNKLKMMARMTWIHLI